MRTMTARVLAMLVLWVACSVSQNKAEAGMLKLCGRELIRAVVFTCGGSRWRRLLNQQLPPDVDSEDQVPGYSIWHSATRRDLSSKCCEIGCHKIDLAKLC